MKSRKEYVILAGVVVLLILYLILRHSDRALYELPEISSLETAEISRLEIHTPDEFIRLDKQEDQWVLMPEAFPAAESKVDQMLAGLSDLTLTALVSESKNYSRYQLTDAEKILVKAWRGDRLVREVAIGKTAPSRRHTFIRLADDPDVYHARNNLRSRFDQTAAQLRDKTVLRFNAGDIHEIEIRKADETRLISRAEADVPGDAPENKGPLWRDAAGNTVPASEVEALLNPLSGLKCREFMEEDRKAELSDPIWTITLIGKKDHKLSIFEKETEDARRYPATSEETQTPFYLSTHRADTIMGAMNEDED